MRNYQKLAGPSRRNLGLLGASVLAIMVASPAYAQSSDGQAVSPDTDQDTAQTVTTPETNSGNDGAIVVTGSRIRSVTPYNSPDPISIIDPDVVAKEGKLDLASTLQSSPVAAGSTQITSAISSNFVTNGGPGAQTIDLRGLGANRTLVLLNGRRAGRPERAAACPRSTSTSASGARPEYPDPENRRFFGLWVGRDRGRGQYYHQDRYRRNRTERQYLDAL